MEFAFSKKEELVSKQQELVSIQQELKLLALEENSEKITFVKNLIAQGWQEFSSLNPEFSKGYQWVVHPSVAALDWQDDCFDPKEEGVDSELYYDLY